MFEVDFDSYGWIIFAGITTKLTVVYADGAIEAHLELSSVFHQQTVDT